MAGIGEDVKRRMRELTEKLAEDRITPQELDELASIMDGLLERSERLGYKQFIALAMARIAVAAKRREAKLKQKARAA